MSSQYNNINISSIQIHTVILTEYKTTQDACDQVYFNINS